MVSGEDEPPVHKYYQILLILSYNKTVWKRQARVIWCELHVYIYIYAFVQESFQENPGMFQQKGLKSTKDFFQ